MDDIFQRTLGLSLPAVGIAFRDSPPAGVPHAAAGPASCSYWKRAAEGEVFWTDAGDHQNCPIGRSEEHTSELQSLTNLVCRLLLEKKKKKKKTVIRVNND